MSQKSTEQAKSFTIKSLDKRINPETVAALFGKRTGMGKFKGWELWEIRGIYLNSNDRLEYYLAVKEDLALVDYTFTSILTYLDSAPPAAV